MMMPRLPGALRAHGPPVILTMGGPHALWVKNPSASDGQLLDALTFYSPELRRRLFFLLFTLERQAAGRAPPVFHPHMQAYLGAPPGPPPAPAPVPIATSGRSRGMGLDALTPPLLPLTHHRSFVSVPALIRVVTASVAVPSGGVGIEIMPARGVTTSWDSDSVLFRGSGKYSAPCACSAAVSVLPTCPLLMAIRPRLDDPAALTALLDQLGAPAAVRSALAAKGFSSLRRPCPD